MKSVEFISLPVLCLILAYTLLRTDLTRPCSTIPANLLLSFIMARDTLLGLFYLICISLHCHAPPADPAPGAGASFVRNHVGHQPGLTKAANEARLDRTPVTSKSADTGSIGHIESPTPTRVPFGILKTILTSRSFSHTLLRPRTMVCNPNFSRNITCLEAFFPFCTIEYVALLIYYLAFTFYQPQLFNSLLWFL